MSKLFWPERLKKLVINPDLANSVDVLRMAEELLAAESRLAELKEALKVCLRESSSMTMQEVRALAAQPNVAVAKFYPNNEDGCPNDPDPAQKGSA